MRYLPTLAQFERLSFAGAAVAAVALVAPAANATPETITLNFTASNFSPTAPVDPVTGSITLTFDPNVSVNTDTATGITLDSVNIPVDLVHNQLEFQYQTFGFESILTFGTNQGGAGLGVDSGANQFEAVIENPDPTVLSSGADPTTLFDFVYSQTGTGDTFISETGSVTVSGITATAVPEPATLALFGAGLMGMAGLVGLRRRKLTTA